MQAQAVLIECQVYDPVSATTKTLRFCNRNDPRVAAYGDLEWRPIITKSPAVGASVFNGDFTGFGEVTIDEFKISADQKDLDEIMRYTWHGAKVKILGGSIQSETYKRIFTAVGQGISRNGNVDITVGLATMNYKLDGKELLWKSYAGTGDIEGTSDIEGVLKPMVFGVAKYCRPVLIDEVRQIYQVHGYGPVESIDMVFEGGLAIGAGPAATQNGTYAAFRDTVVSQGTWIRHNDLGLIKLGSQPSFPITCHVKGDSNGVSGGACLKKAGDIVKRMITMNVAGISVSNASLAALNISAPQNLDLYFEDQITILEAVAMTLRSVGGYWIWNELGNMIFGRMRFSAAATRVGFGPELIKNGDFSAGTKFWTPSSNASISVVGDNLEVQGDGTGSYPSAYQDVVLTQGKRYKWWINILGGDKPPWALFQINQSGVGPVVQIQDYLSGNGIFTGEFVASATTVFQVLLASEQHNAPTKWNGVSIREVDSLVLSEKNEVGPTDVLNISQTPTGAPVWSMRLGANVCHFVHDASSIVQSLIDLKENVSKVTKDMTVVSINYADDDDLLKDWIIRSGPGTRTYGNSIDGMGGGSFNSTGAGITYTYGAELVTNGTGGSTAGWTPVNCTLDLNSGMLRLTTTTTAPGYAYQQLTGLTVGQTYEVTLDSSSQAGVDAYFEISEDAAGATDLLSVTTEGNGQIFTFVATQTSLYVRLIANTTNNGKRASFDNIGVKSKTASGGQDGETWLEWAGDPMPYDPAETYEVQATVKRDSGSGVVWAGILGLAADKTTIVGTDGTANYQKVHWVAAAGANPGSSKKVFLGYITGKAAAGTAIAANSVDAPGVAHNNVGWMKPSIRLNSQGDGTMKLLGFRILRAHNVDRGKSGNYGKILASQMTASGEHKLTDGATLMQIGDQRNLPPVKALNLGFKYTGSVSVSAGTSSATVTIGSGQYLIGSGGPISYNGTTINISKGAGETTVTYHFYLTDATYSGGTKTISATQNSQTPYGADDRVYVGSITWTWPASGTTTTDGYSGGGGCVETTMVVPTLDGPKLARDVKKGDLILTLTPDLESEEWIQVEKNLISIEHGYEWTSESGVSLRFSETTPLTLEDGSAILPHWYAGERLPIKVRGGFRWEHGTLKPVGPIEVARISCHSRTYAAGKNADELVFTHNLTQYEKP